MKNRMFGLGEPLTMDSLRGGDLQVSLDRLEAFGCTAFREWIHIPTVLADPVTPKQDMVDLYTRAFNRMKELDIEITGMSHSWFLAGEGNKPSHNGMYSRDLTPGSLYMQTLEMMEQSWVTMASLFPQVEQWEVGNEWNLDMFLHPIGWEGEGPGFPESELMDIAVDMQYFSARGVRKGNPNAKVVCFAPAIVQPNLGGQPMDFCPDGYGIARAISEIYKRIKSGNFWSTNTDDYFDMLAWHPYLQTHIAPRTVCTDYPATDHYLPREGMDAHWKAMNDIVYDIMVRNGDGHKKVLLSEMGFTDWGDEEVEKIQVEMTEQLFEMVKSMPYIKTIHYFRMYSADAKKVGKLFNVLAEVYFGLYARDGNQLTPRPKAYKLQEIYGGTKPLI